MMKNNQRGGGWMEYIPIDKNAIPYRFDISLAGEIFTFEVNYNSRFDYFTIDVEKNKEVIMYGAKVVYGHNLFSVSNDPRLPKIAITPLDFSYVEQRVGFNNLGQTIYLFVGDTPLPPSEKFVDVAVRFDGAYSFDGNAEF